jgi:transposase
LEAACEAYNTLRWADTYFYHEDGKGLTLTELRQLALDLRKQDEEYQQLYSQVVQQIASMRLGSAFSMGLQDSRGKRNPISTTPWFIRRAGGGY